MTTYIKIPLETNPETLAQEVFEYIKAFAPNYVAQDGNLDVWIIRAVAQLAAENRDIASDVQDDIFRYFGATIMGIPPIDAISATGNTTWNLIDALGHTIPAGTTVGVRNSAGELIPFLVTTDVVVPNGSTATSAGGVTISAVIPGVSGTALGSVGANVELIDVIDWVQGITLTGATSGGVDAETDAIYLDRLVKRLRRLSQRPILPADFSAMAIDADPTVQRAVAIDGYNPAGATYGNERMVTVAAVKSDGTAVSAGVKTKIQSYLQSNREINFVVNVMDPNYTTINVAVSIVIATGFLASAVNASVVSAVQGYLSPANWGQDPTIQEASAATTWVETPKVYYNEMITLISNVLGVDRVTALTLNGGTADINLTTPAALTTAGTVTVTDV